MARAAGDAAAAAVSAVALVAEAPHSNAVEGAPILPVITNQNYSGGGGRASAQPFSPPHGDEGIYVPEP